MSNAPNIPKIIEQELHYTDHIGERPLICEHRRQPGLLYGIFLQLVRQFYSYEGHDILGGIKKIWDNDITKTEIWIDTEARWEDEAPEFRPAIYIKLGPIQYGSLGNRNDGYMYSDTPEGVKAFNRRGTGTVSFVHIGGTAGEAVGLADNTFDYLDAFSSVIRDDFCFTIFTPTTIQPMARLARESKDRFGSILEFKYVFDDEYYLKLESQRLKKIAFKAGQNVFVRDIVTE